MTTPATTPAIIRTALADGVRVRQRLLDEVAGPLAAAANLMRDAVIAGHKVLLCGNGGSAADAQHIAAELVGRYVVERRPLPAIALTTDSSALTAIANDYGFEQVFARQVQALGQPGDVLIAITTSGNSPNVHAAITAARSCGMHVIGMTGGRGAAFAAACDIGIAVPSTVTARIQECHIIIGHLLCEVLDHAFAPTAEVGELGSAVARLTDSAKEYTLPELIAWRETCRTHKRTVAWTNGVFDVLHSGHLASLRGARAHGDVLVVGVNADASVRANKGPDRPIFSCRERVEMLTALEIVDAVVVFDEPTPAAILAAVKPDVHVKGADYAPPNGKPIPEREIVEAYGGRIEFIPLVPDRSSTGTLARLLATTTSKAG
jgi:phosphoheptose isomerase